MSRHIAFLDSWFQSSAQGSGTAVGIGGLQQALGKMGHVIHRLAPTSPWPKNHLMRRLWFNRQLPSRIRERNYDLVVGFDIDGFAYSPRRRKGPYVVSVKGVLAEEAQRETGKYYWLLKSLSLLECFNARNADRVITTSNYCRKAIVHHYEISHKKIHIVPEGIDLPFWNGLVEKVFHHGDGKTILCVGRQYRRKRVIDLLRAVVLVREAIPEVRVLIVGAGPEHRKLRQAVRSLGIGDNVSLLGELERDEDVAQLYRRSDVFCLPSIQEGFGIVYLEAMAVGLPIVATTATAIPEVVPHDMAGILVPPRDVQSLARALIRLLGNPHERQDFGSFGRQHVKQYDWPLVATRFLAEVGDLLTKLFETANRVKSSPDGSFSRLKKRNR